MRRVGRKSQSAPPHSYRPFPSRTANTPGVGCRANWAYHYDEGRESKMSIDDFLIKDYELKVKFLTDQYQRMWTRFNFFVTIESGFIGGKLINGSGPLTPWLALVGAILSLACYVFGAQDR